MKKSFLELTELKYLLKKTQDFFEVIIWGLFSKGPFPARTSNFYFENWLVWNVNISLCFCPMARPLVSGRVFWVKYCGAG